MSVSVVILCEDELHAFFARFFLRCKNWHSKNLRVEKGPSGKGSGEQFVCENLPGELKKLRQFPDEARALIIVTDADNHSVEERTALLKAQCVKQNVEPWNDDEPVFLLIPRWEIQNWLAYLAGKSAGEENLAGYGQGRSANDWRAEVKKLARMCEDGKLGGKPPESLNLACGEYRRFRKLVRQ